MTADEAAPAYRTTIVLPHDQLGMNTGRKEISGKPARVKCITCHAAFEPREGYQRAKNIPGLHEAITVDHGDLTCQACHNPPRFQDFRMADGGTVDYADVMDLCGQCHGAIKKDYDNGAHGGMRGHWDLNTGPRDRNHCLHCHNAHRPAVPLMVPAPAPKYRFMNQQINREHADGR